MTSAVAELGYANVRITDVVDRARVSKQSFYAQFADKEECFLAAHAQGVALILQRLSQWASDHAEPEPRSQIRGAIRAYLELATEEPEFAHCMLVELQAIGTSGLEARLDAHRRIAALVEVWHADARRTAPSWPAVPTARYRAVVGALHDLVFEAVTGQSGQIPTELEADALDAALVLLQIPPG
ncbi:MAG: TetR/AcrR family transcriptional regulator [Solirubrobacteraceae bacterium]